MIIDCKYEFGTVFYLISDEEQKKRVFTELKVLSNGGFEYGLSCGIDHSFHYENEFTTEKDLASV